ncbi:MarR family winged helix-turn-helix transcriptional regulator [Streptomyces sp. NPDC060322]|uniref:MarR family winged helix-turn-helix transcriptional regulator n=1 Tax=Streptomyces sp. NPDC060322 TaxID=3347097 RepID=UPI0036465D58
MGPGRARSRSSDKQEPGLSGAALARRSMVTPQTMSSVLANLEGRGLVERRPHPVHQHILEARLTRTGHSLVRRADEVVQEIEDRLLSRLGEDEAKTFLAQLELCSQALGTARPAPERPTTRSH